VLFDLSVRLDLARPLVREKIEGGRRLLSTLEVTGAGEPRALKDAIRRMAEAFALASDAAATPDLHILRGARGRGGTGLLSRLRAVVRIRRPQPSPIA